ncbi:hypothetical protein WJX77_007989 [Trebouxia sp. C0004]
MISSQLPSFARLSARLSTPKTKAARVKEQRCCSSADAATLATEEQTGPTFVPRRDGITDGKWDQRDEAAVEIALQDAQKASRRRSASQPGTVLLGQTVEELGQLAKDTGQSAYRGKQLYDGLMHGARQLDHFNQVPKKWREELRERQISTGRSKLHHSVTAADGTRKFLLQLHDGLIVEAVGIPADDADKSRLTACVSSQVGCPMRCTFCATGKGGFARNLKAHEIVDQVMTVQEEFGTRVSNIVFMGMGEPLLNLPSVMRAHTMLNENLGVGQRHITISTVGVPNAIMKLASHNLQSTLAISIHAPNQQLREQLVPSAKVYPLEALMLDCQQYFRVTGRRVTFEYTVLAGVNDTPILAEQLANLLRRFDLRSHVNLIPWNPVDDSGYKRPDKAHVKAFANVLEMHRVPVSIRVSRGMEAAAACGQLRNQHQKSPLQGFAALT